MKRTKLRFIRLRWPKIFFQRTGSWICISSTHVSLQAIPAVTVRNQINHERIHMTEAEDKGGVYVPAHLDWHDVGCIKRYGAEGDEPCECEKRRANQLLERQS
jgi:hypothetical protein